MSQLEQDLIDQIMSRKLSLYDLPSTNLSGLDLGFAGSNGINFIRACLLVNDHRNAMRSISYLFNESAPITAADLEFARNVFPEDPSVHSMLVSLLQGRALELATEKPGAPVSSATSRL